MTQVWLYLSRPARTLERATVIGVLGGLTLYLCLALVGLVSMPWTGTGDSLYHLDYIYQLSQGHLPEPYGLEFSYSGDTPSSTGRQYASAHPPLYYALASTFMGPLLQAGDWVIAVALGRLLNVVFGALTYLVLAWCGWTFGGRSRSVLAITLPALGALTTPFVLFSGEIYNDVLVTFLSVLALAVGCLVIRDGPTRGRVALLSVVTAAGLATKATFVVTAAVVVVALVAGTMLNGRGSQIRRLVRGALLSLLVFAVSAVSIGWFYLRNAALSGSLVRSTAKAPLQGRPEKTLMDNLLSEDFWLVFFRGLLGNIKWNPGFPYNRTISLIVVASCLVSIGIWAVSRRPLRLSRRTWFIGLLLVLHLAGLQVAQLYHATGFGAYNWRYFMPATLQMALLLAGGSLLWGRRGKPVAVATVLMLALGSLGNTMWLVTVRNADITGGAIGWPAMGATAAANGFPSWVLPTLAAGAVFGFAVLAVSILRAGQTPVSDMPSDAPVPDRRALRRHRPTEA